MRHKASLPICLAALVALAAGCGGDGLNRLDLTGQVTYKGQPVPYGTISFRPDHSKGGTGPTGFARIEDGQYDTSGEGKAAMVGPVKVFIEGAVSKEPMAASLFPMYRTSIDVNGEKDQFDFEVPEGPPQKKRR